MLPQGKPAAPLHTDSLLAENSLLRRAQCLPFKPSILYCCDVEPAGADCDPSTSWPLQCQTSWTGKQNTFCKVWNTFKRAYVWLLKLLALSSHAHIYTLWMHYAPIAWNGSRRWEVGECAPLDCILLLFTAQRVAPRRNRTLPENFKIRLESVWRRIDLFPWCSIAPRGWVSMVFDFPLSLFLWIAVSTFQLSLLRLPLWHRLLETWAEMVAATPVFLFFFVIFPK